MTDLLFAIHVLKHNGHVVFTKPVEFQEEDGTMDMQLGNQNYLLPRNKNNQQESPGKRIVYNDNNLVRFSHQKKKKTRIYIYVFIKK